LRTEVNRKGANQRSLRGFALKSSLKVMLLHLVPMFHFAGLWITKTGLVLNTSFFWRPVR